MRLLLEAVREECPDAFCELHYIVEHVREAHEDEMSLPWPQNATVGVTILELALEWASEHNLASTLIALTVGHTLEYWLKDPEAEEEQRIGPAPIIRVEPMMPDPPRPYKPWRETRQEYLHELTGGGKYLDQVEEEWCDAAKAQGWQVHKTPEKRSRGGGPTLHFRWLAQYQVLGNNLEEIGQAYLDEDQTLTRKPVEDGAIRKAIQTTAVLVGITLRK